MRLTFALRYDKINQNIQSRQESLDKVTTMASSGYRLTQPGDDPLAWSKAMDLKQGLRQFDTFEKNLNFGTQWNQATENALNSFSDLLMRAKEAGMSFSSASTPDAQAGLVNEIDQLTQQAYTVANSKFGDLYLFGGKNTSSAPQAPFLDGDPTYLGDQANPDMAVRTGSSQPSVINLDGLTVFSTDPADPTNSSIFKTLSDLKVAVQSGDTNQIQTQLSALETAQQHISSMQTKVGARLNQFEEKLTALGSLRTDRQEVLADTQEADMVDVITQLQQKRTALEAALRVTTYADDMNLTKYLQ